MEKNPVVRHVVIIGGSAGSLDTLLKILPNLTPQSAAGYALVIVLHRRSAEDTTLEELIARKTEIPVREVEDKTLLQEGVIYIAPSDYHLLFEKNGLLSLDTSEKINYSRPSIDVSFEAAADVYGPQLTAILLSGANSDGTAGMHAVKAAGGTVIVQDPDSVEIDFMPRNALENMAMDKVLDTAEILEFLTRYGQ